MISLNYNDSPIRVYTRNTYEEISELLRFLNRSAASTMKLMAALAVINIVLGVANVAGAFYFPSVPKALLIPNAVILLLVGLLFGYLALRNNRNNGMSEKDFKRNYALLKDGFHLSFMQHRFEYTAKSEGFRSTCSYDYKLVGSVKESSSLVIILLKNNSYLFFNKGSLHEDTVREIKTLIKEESAK